MTFPFPHFVPSTFKRDLKPIKPSTVQRDHQREQHNSIIMNDDCKLLQVQDEHATTCADKYCKNFQATTAQQYHNEEDKNASKINEISTTNSRINRKHNLNLDLYFDKELSEWLAERERKQQQIEPRTDKDNKIAITNAGNDMTTTTSRDDECYSSEKLSNEMISIGTNNFDDNSSNSHRHFSDSFSSSSTSTCHNSEIDTQLIDARRYRDEKSEKGKSSTFTDGEYIYGPYNFDLFSNEFYHFRDEHEPANDDEAEKHRRINNSELLKNHDEVDNAAEVSFVRDMETEKGCEILRNHNSDDQGTKFTLCFENQKEINFKDFIFESSFDFLISSFIQLDFILISN